MFESKINRGRANGYAPLDGSGKVPLDKLPPIQSTIDTGSFATTSSLQTLVDVTGSFVTTASFNEYTASVTMSVSINTSSFATTGSNQFYGDQSISGSLNVSSSLVVSSTFVNNGTIDALNSDLIIDGGDIILSGSLYFGSGSVISETDTAISITPFGAAAGQSLVIRPTAGQFYISASNLDGFVPGESISISVLTQFGEGIGALDYEFTEATAEQLGTSTTGTLTFSSESEKTLTWTIPAQSDMTTFTFSLISGSGFVESGGVQIFALPNITITLDGSIVTENSHIHLVSGDPSMVDIYLGDDDNYIKVEKNAGDVVIGTNLDTHHWRFGADGILKLNNELGEIYADPDDYSVRIGTAAENVAPNAQIILGGQDTIFKIKAGPPSVEWDFGGDGTLTTPGDIIVTGSIYADNLVGLISSSAQITEFGFVSSSAAIPDGTISGSTQITEFGFVSGSYETTGRGIVSGSSQLTNAFPLKTTGSWTILPGTANYSFTLNPNSTYQMWILGNVPNGIIKYNANVTISNTNVPVLGTHSAWNYIDGGSPLLITTLPRQIVGVNGTISTSVPGGLGTNTNIFSFEIQNNTIGSFVVNYGYVKLS